MKKLKVSKLISVCISTFTMVAFTACATRPNNGATSTANEYPSDLNSYRNLNLKDYIAPYAHDDIKVPQGAPAVLNVAGFSSNQPQGESRTLAQIAVRIREATPAESAALKANGKGTVFTSAVITIKAAPGFTLSKLHGAEKSSPIADGVIITLDSLKYGEWRVFIAEFEGIHSPGTERLLGGSLRCTQLADGAVFETTTGEKIDWQRSDVPVKVNKWVARNALIFSNGEALKEAGSLTEKNDHVHALSLLDLQLNSTRILKDFDAIALDQETHRLLAIRAQVAKNMALQNSDIQIPPVPETSPLPDAATRTTLAVKGVESAKQSPRGLWGTVAKLLVLVKG